MSSQVCSMGMSKGTGEDILSSLVKICQYRIRSPWGEAQDGSNGHVIFPGIGTGKAKVIIPYVGESNRKCSSTMYILN